MLASLAGQHLTKCTFKGTDAYGVGSFHFVPGPSGIGILLVSFDGTCCNKRACTRSSCFHLTCHTVERMKHEGTLESSLALTHKAIFGKCTHEVAGE